MPCFSSKASAHTHHIGIWCSRRLAGQGRLPVWCSQCRSAGLPGWELSPPSGPNSKMPAGVAAAKGPKVQSRLLCRGVSDCSASAGAAGVPLPERACMCRRGITTKEETQRKISTTQQDPVISMQRSINVTFYLCVVGRQCPVELQSTKRRTGFNPPRSFRTWGLVQPRRQPLGAAAWLLCGAGPSTKICCV